MTNQHVLHSCWTTLPVAIRCLGGRCFCGQKPVQYTTTSTCATRDQLVQLLSRIKYVLPGLVNNSMLVRVLYSYSVLTVLYKAFEGPPQDRRNKNCRTNSVRRTRRARPNSVMLRGANGGSGPVEVALVASRMKAMAKSEHSMTKAFI